MSRVKKHHNPLEESLSIVRRDDLQETPLDQQSDPVANNQQLECTALNTLEEILAPLRNDFVKATRGSKRKRCTSPAHEARESQKTELRLLSRRPTVISEPQIMSGWPSRQKIHSTEDDEEEEIERRRRAKLAAIDVKTIMKQSLIRYPAYKCANMEERKTIEPTSVGPMAVLESGQQPTGPRLSEHSGGSLSICRVPKPKRDLLVHAHPTQLAIGKSRSASRNHSFYSSADTLGGKSPGYAWGYAGSFPRSEESSGYIRDNMRKGLSQERSLQLANGADSPGLGSRRVGKGA